MEKHDRRFFLKECACLTTAAAACSLFPACTSADASGKAETKDRWLSVGKLADFPDGKRTLAALAVRVADGKTEKKPKLVVIRKGGRAFVLSAKCTHFGCQVDPLENGSFHCPCHRSAFDKNGTVTHGPAKHPLPWYEVKMTESGEIQVNVNKTIEVPKLE